MNFSHIALDIENYTLHALDMRLAISSSSTITPIPPFVITSSNYSNSYTNSSATSSNTTFALGVENIRLQHAPHLSNSAMTKVYVLSIIAFFSLLGNILTMWNIYKTRISRRSSRHSWSAIYSLIFHLSIADVLVTGFCIIGEAAWYYTVQWLADELTCKLVKLCQMFSLYLSTYVLVLIGVDRWIAVKYPMKSLNMAKRCYRLLGCTYVFSFILSLPQFFIFHVARGPFIEEFHQCVTHGFYTAEWQEQLYATFTLVFTFLLPLCILFGTYLSTFRTISSSEKIFQSFKMAAYKNETSAQTNRQRLIQKAKMKSLRISVVIIFAFAICWTPYYVTMMIFLFSNPEERLGEDMNSAIFFFGMSNSLVNPLIYGAFHLCPVDRKVNGKASSNQNPHSLNGGDSQRTILTGVTQIDGSGRQIRNFRQPLYYLDYSNINVTPAPLTVSQNSTSVHSSHPLYDSHALQNSYIYTNRTHVHSNTMYHHNQHAFFMSPSVVFRNGDSKKSTDKIMNYQQPRVTTLHTNSLGSLNVISVLGTKSTAVIGYGGGNSIVGCSSLHSNYPANESISSV